MHSPVTRPILRLKLTLAEHIPLIVREVEVASDLTLADLAPVVTALFGNPRCTRHVYTRTHEHDGWTRNRERWGDTWTMIDLRDPTVLDETTAPIGTVLRAGEPLWFAHTCDSAFAVHIVRGTDLDEHGSGPSVRVVSGEGAAPLPCTRGPLEHQVLLDMFGEPEHPLHDALCLRLAAVFGPWATYEPARFDLAEAQDAVERAARGAATREHVELLNALHTALPPGGRAGLRNHIDATGLALPVIVTADEAAHMLRELSWVLARADGEGIPLTDTGEPDLATAHDDLDAAHVDSTRLNALIAAARTLRLVYRRKGRLVTKKAASAALIDPVEVWNVLVQAIATEPLTHSPSARELLFLAIADGSAGDPSVGMTRVADAFASLMPAPGWHEWGHHPESDACDHGCECPQIGGANWHEVIDASVRDAGRLAGQDGYQTVVSRLGHSHGVDIDLPREWFGDLTGTQRLPDSWREEPVSPDENEAAFLQAAAKLIEVLSMFGLSRDDDGSWIVPHTLQQFARAVIQSRRTGWGGRYGNF